MCFNSKTSIITFTISVLCSVWLLSQQDNKCDIFFSVVVFLIGCMQLIEYFLWENQDCSKNSYNHMFSLLIIALLFIQGVGACIVYYYLYPAHRFVNRKIVNIYLFAYTCFFIYMMQYLNKFKLCSKPSATSCRLQWAPYSVLATHNVPMIIIHLAFYAFAGIIIGAETINSNFADVMKYKVRYSIVPIVFLASILYVLYKEISHAQQFLKNPFIFLDYIDVFGSVFCFSAVILGIVSVLHI